MCFQAQTSLNAATANGAGSTIDLGRNASSHTMIVRSTGSPTAGDVTLQFSHDGTNWSSPSGSLIDRAGHFHGEFVARYVRANLASLSGGSSPTVTATIASVE